MHLDRCAANQDQTCERPRGQMTVQDVYRIDSEKYEQAIRRHLENVGDVCGGDDGDQGGAQTVVRKSM